MQFDNQFYKDQDILSQFEAPDHLPLDWNENISLEDYLERLDKKQK